MMVYCDGEKEFLFLGHLFALLLMMLILGDIETGKAQDGGKIKTYESCFERCDEIYIPGKPCYCNEACDQYENCCSDFYVECKPNYTMSDEWQNYSGHQYMFFRNLTTNALQARVSCRTHGALLVSINNKAEQTFIEEKVLRKRVVSAYIGGTDEITEGEWLWADGERMPMPNDAWQAWYNGEPDEAGAGEDCSVITNYMYWAYQTPKLALDTYWWRDQTCLYNSANEIQGYICERTMACHPNPCQNNGTCLYVGSDEGYACQCIMGYLGDHCQYQKIANKNSKFRNRILNYLFDDTKPLYIVKEGEEWTICGQTNITDTHGDVTSPLYPKPYPRNVRCEWVVQVPSTSAISISLKDMEIEQSKNCALDYLAIYDGTSRNDSVLLSPACGNLATNQTSLQSTMRSSSNQILIVFHTDDSVQQRGFQINFLLEKCGLGQGDSGCGTRKIFTSECGEFSIDRGPVIEDPCEWHIIVDPDKIIRLSMIEFKIQDTGMNCLTGALDMYDGTLETGRHTERACGERFPWISYSRSNQITLLLSGVKWTASTDVIKIQYTAIDPSTWTVINPISVIRGTSGHFSTDSSDLHVRTGRDEIYKWMLEVPPGDKINITWQIQMFGNASFLIYDGSSVESTVIFNMTVYDDSPVMTEPDGSLIGRSHHVLVKVVKARGNAFSLKASFTSVEWIPEFSGCYRPQFYFKPSSLGTENNIITRLEPAAIMVSNHSKAKGGYEAGLYCKWLVEGTPGMRLRFDVLEAVIKPLSEDCVYDGFVVYDGDSTTSTKHGPFCGSSVLRNKHIDSSSNKMLLVFYSDSRGSDRTDGVFRAMIRLKDIEDCQILQMQKPESVTKALSCAVIVSPGFPGMVQPGLWSWTVVPPPGHYVILYVYYVRGPSHGRHCEENFKVIEIAKDSATLKQEETSLMKICAGHDLFVPSQTIKVPPDQKVAIVLNTVQSSLPARWEFKVAVLVDQLPTPDGIKENTTCPEEYYNFQNNCYRYYYWLWQRIHPKNCSFQDNWQNALHKCEVENSTLVSIHSEEEAYFIKWMLSGKWFWNPAGSYRSNHRIIYVGLHNKYGDYVWTDESRLGYADWYEPPPEWAQSAFPVGNFGVDLMNPSYPQPTADVGSLCTVMINKSPFGSLGWAKIPCDYPIAQAGMICKQPAKDQEHPTYIQPLQEELGLTYGNSITVCPPDWITIRGGCFMLYTDFMENHSNTASNALVKSTNESYLAARSLCHAKQGFVYSGESEYLETIYTYLRIWNHLPKYGHIWIRSHPDTNQCRFIKVYKNHRLDENVIYEIKTSSCSELDGESSYPRGVLCQRQSVEIHEECGQHEFRCGNDVCVSVDHVCDGIDDCFDNSDEEQCECNSKSFHCRNGKCVSASLYCDFKDHCGDGSDEENCVKEYCGPNEFTCDNGQCIPSELTCNFWLDCADGSDEMRNACRSPGRTCRGFLCYSGTCLHPDLQYDKISDCPGLSMEDERETQTFLKMSNSCRKDRDKVNKTEGQGCSEGAGYTRCHEGEWKCYRRSSACIFDSKTVDERRSVNVMTSCRDGAHLCRKCDKIECPRMFHCGGSYCLPYRKVCDGIKDCPSGDDETNCDDYICPGLFRCKGGNFCLPHSEVCDGTPHCPDHDDEKYCGMIDIICNVCSCIGYSASCESRNLTTLPLPLIGSVDNKKSRHLRSLTLAHNQVLLEIDLFKKLHFLGILNLSNNSISHLPDKIFQDMRNLFDLNLSFNRLTEIQQSAFVGLQSLRKLDLSHNRLYTLGRTTLAVIDTTEHLIITHNQFTDVTVDTFFDVGSLRVLNTDAYKFCCIAKQVKNCTPEPDEFSSCEDLMANSALQVSIWVLGIIAFIGNLFVIIWRIRSPRKSISSFFILNLGCSDFIMGIYLLIVASVDVYYRGQYIVYADSWRNSFLCQLAGMLALLSSELSVFMLTAITADRVASLLFPLRMGAMRMSHARFVVISGWIVCIVLSILPLIKIAYFGDAFFGRTGVCLPLQVTNEKQPGWEYAVFIFLAVNFASFIAIFIGYLAIFVAVRSSVKSIGTKSTKNYSEYSLAKKLVIIVATDFLCWVPIIAIGFAALSGAKILPQVSAWIAVFILPLNSAINPILYTISEFDCKGKKKNRKKRVQTPLCHRSHRAISNSSPTMHLNGGNGGRIRQSPSSVDIPMDAILDSRL